MDKCSKVIIKTGNVINNNDALKRPGKNAADELWEGLKSAAGSGERIINGDELVIQSSQKVTTDGVDPTELLTTVKIFVNSDSKDLLQEAIHKCLSYVEMSRLSILILAYHPTGPLDSLQEGLKALWTVLQSCVDDKVVDHIGVADVETDAFIELYNWARIKPNIVHISLAGCCVVPPLLQEFTKAHEIQLLTHSDPSEMLPKDKLEEILPAFPVRDFYIAKYQAHIKCRGVLATKGYLLCAHR